MDGFFAPGRSADGTLSRRTLLRGVAGGAALLASGGLPAWARPVSAAARVRTPDSRPFPHLPAGHSSMPEIEHIVVLIMENHSFDNLLGMVPYQIPGRASVDGLTRRQGKFQNFNPTRLAATSSPRTTALRVS